MTSSWIAKPLSVPTTIGDLDEQLIGRQVSSFPRCRTWDHCSQNPETWAALLVLHRHSVHLFQKIITSVSVLKSTSGMLMSACHQQYRHRFLNEVIQFPHFVESRVK